MTKKLVDIFKNTKKDVAPEGLLETILFEIEREKVISVRRYTVFSSFVALFSSYGTYISFVAFDESASFSGFYDISSLLFRDTVIILSFFEDYLFSVAESLPIIEISFFVLFFLPMFVSFNYISKNIKIVFKKV